jgi:hypothetical protein
MGNEFKTHHTSNGSTNAKSLLIADFQSVTDAFTVSSSIPLHFGSQRGAN